MTKSSVKTNKKGGKFDMTERKRLIELLDECRNIEGIGMEKGMKKFTTCSDGGSFLFGNKDFAFKLSNNFGDCDNTVLLFDTYREFAEYCKEEYGKNWHNKLKWIMPINGKINLYNYDCSDMKDEDITVELDGYYDIYLYNNIYEYPTLAIVKDEERQHI